VWPRRAPLRLRGNAISRGRSLNAQYRLARLLCTGVRSLPKSPRSGWWTRISAVRLLRSGRSCRRAIPSLAPCAPGSAAVHNSVEKIRLASYTEHKDSALSQEADLRSLKSIAQHHSNQATGFSMGDRGLPGLKSSFPSSWPTTDRAAANPISRRVKDALERPCTPLNRRSMLFGPPSPPAENGPPKVALRDVCPEAGGASPPR
jgi:hypothetical protein